MISGHTCPDCGIEFLADHRTVYCAQCGKQRKNDSNKGRFASGTLSGRGRNFKAYCPTCAMDGVDPWHRTNVEYSGRGIHREYCDRHRKWVEEGDYRAEYKVVLA